MSALYHTRMRHSGRQFRHKVKFCFKVCSWSQDTRLISPFVSSFRVLIRVIIIADGFHLLYIHAFFLILFNYAQGKKILL
jgi:hypothetical protein